MVAGGNGTRRLFLNPCLQGQPKTCLFLLKMGLLSFLWSIMTGAGGYLSIRYLIVFLALGRGWWSGTLCRCTVRLGNWKRDPNNKAQPCLLTFKRRAANETRCVVAETESKQLGSAFSPRSLLQYIPVFPLHVLPQAGFCLWYFALLAGVAQMKTFAKSMNCKRCSLC